jgi:hypothetical protein
MYDYFKFSVNKSCKKLIKNNMTLENISLREEIKRTKNHLKVILNKHSRKWKRKKSRINLLIYLKMNISKIKTNLRSISW